MRLQDLSSCAPRVMKAIQVVLCKSYIKCFKRHYLIEFYVMLHRYNSQSMFPNDTFQLLSLLYVFRHLSYCCMLNYFTLWFSPAKFLQYLNKQETYLSICWSSADLFVTFSNWRDDFAVFLITNKICIYL